MPQNANRELKLMYLCPITTCSAVDPAFHEFYLFCTLADSKQWLHDVKHLWKVMKTRSSLSTSMWLAVAGSSPAFVEGDAVHAGHGSSGGISS